MRTFHDFSGPFTAAAIALSLGPGAARAGGFQVTELCAECSGSRIAGQAAKASGPATVWFNPAAMIGLDGRQLDVSAHYISGKFEFSNRDSRKALSVLSLQPPAVATPGGPAEGRQVDDGAKGAVVPNVYLTWKLDDDWSAGIGINTPYGLATKYDSNWVGRYHGVKSELTAININPSMAYRVNEWLSLGAGLNALYADAELTNAVDVGSIATAVLPGVAGAIGLAPASPGSDGFSKLTGNDWGWGWNVGALIRLNGNRTRIGASFRSRVETALDGTLKTELPAQLAVIGAGSKIESKGTADLDLPATINLGLVHDLNARWTVLAGAIWTGWSSFEDITVRLEDGGRIEQPEHWQDSWRYQLGLEYRASPRWTLRAGAEYDESPVRRRYNTPRIPDADRRWLALGFTYRYSDSLDVDFAYSHIFVDDYRLSDTEVFTEQAGELLGEQLGIPVGDRLHGVGNVLDGGYDADADIVSLGVRYRF